MCIYAERFGIERDRVCWPFVLDNVTDFVEAVSLFGRPQEHFFVVWQRCVDYHGKPSQGRSAFDVGEQIRRDLDAFVGRAEDEIAGVENEVLALFDDRFGDVLVDFALGVGVDTGDVRPLKFEELPSQSEVDACGLDLQVGIVERIDDEVAVREAIEDVRIREDHIRRVEGLACKPFDRRSGWDDR